MRRWHLLLALLLGLGCDDSSLPGRVANAQLHGLVAAQISCETDESELIYNGGLNQENLPALALLQVTLFLDGSSLVATMPTDPGPRADTPMQHVPQVGGPSAFYARGTNPDYAQLLRVLGGGVEFVSRVEDGVWSIRVEGPGEGPLAYDSPQTTFSGPVSEYCTGFNLEAFGVAP